MSNKYEYAISTFAVGETAEVEGWLNSLGNKGWELVSVVPLVRISTQTSTTHEKFYLRRIKENE